MKPNALILVAALVAGTAGLISWQVKKEKSVDKEFKLINDTIPSREKKIRNLDEAIEELDPSKMDELIRLSLEQAKRGLQQIDEQKLQEQLAKIDMKQIQLQTKKALLDAELALKSVDLEKVMAEATAEMNKINWDEMRVKQQQALREAEVALKNIDVQKLMSEAQNKLDKTNWNDLKFQQEAMKQAELAMKNVDLEKVMRETKESLAKIDFDKLQVQLDEVKAMKLEDKMKDIQPEIERAMKAAKKDMEKARNELKEYKTLVDGLHTDGLIDKNKAYSVEVKNGELYINDKKAGKATSDKYQWFIKKHPGLQINKTEDDIQVRTDKETI